MDPYKPYFPVSASLFLLASLLVCSCAWESGTPAGPDASTADAQDAGADRGPQYPPPPYGSDYGETVANFAVEKCLCPGGTAQGKSFYLEEYLGAKAVLVVAHSGTCGYCKQQAATMQADLYLPYKGQGLEILLVLIGDARGESERQSLLDYCCEYKERYGLSFTVAADPDVAVMRNYIREGTPLNMLLDKRMVVRYKIEALMPDTLEGNITALLDE